MTEHNFALFETAIGACGIVWSARGVAGVQLPQAERCRDARARAAAVSGSDKKRRRLPTIQSAIDGMVALLRGEPRDLTDVVIDNEGTPEFNARVYTIARQIPPGQTMTYGEIAQRLGDPLLARAVGTALGQNPCPIVMPCHRVLAAGGKDRRLLGVRRRGHETKIAHHRRRATGRADFVRASAAGSGGQKSLNYCA